MAKRRPARETRRTPERSSDPTTSRRQASARGRSTLLAALVIVAAGVAAYSSSFRGVLVWDDVTSIAQNPNIRSLWPLTRSMASPPDVTVAGRPVASFSFALNYALAPAEDRDVMSAGGASGPPEAAERLARNVWGYHAANLTIHLLAALALFGVVRRTLLAGPLRPRFGGASTPLAFVAALLWVVHPLHTESVTYLVQRVESLMGLFYLSTLYCAIRAVDEGPARRWWTVASVAACALGMGTKEVMVTAPIMVWAWDSVLGPRDGGRRWPLYAGLAATWGILAALVASGARTQSTGLGLGGWTAWSYLVTQAGVVAHYLRLAIVPRPLVFDYDWHRAASLADVAPQAIGLVLLAAATVAAAVRRRPIALAGAWLFLILAPTSSVWPIATEVAAEHRMYLPLAAIVVVAVAGAFAAWTRWLPAAGRGVGLACAWLAAGAVVAGFAVMTHARNEDYWSVEALMRDTVEKRPGNARARVAYGAELLGARRFAEAEAQLGVAVGLEAGPRTLAQANMYLGSALCAQGKFAGGIPRLERALALDPTLAEAHGLLGEAYAGQGRLDVAAKQLLQAVAAAPEDPLLLRRAAWILATAPPDEVRDGAKAAELAGRAVRLTGGRDVLSLEALAAAAAEQGRFGDAVSALRQAIDLAPAQGLGSFVPQLQQDLSRCAAGQKLRDPAR